MRNPNPFTQRQLRLLEAIREKIREINDPDPEIITHETYEFSITSTKQFGQLPKIRFSPHCSQIKAAIIENAGMVDEARQEELAQIRQKYGINQARNSLARLFEAEWNNIMLKIKKATYAVALINHMFSTFNQTIAEPINLLQQIVMGEYPQINTKKEPIYKNEAHETAETPDFEGIKPYSQELAELE